MNIDRTSARGFSLVEMMVALALGVVLIGGLVQVFLGIRASFQIQQNLSFIQETGRFAIETLKPELRDAGKLDFCVADLNVNNLLDPGGAGYVAELFDPAQSIVGWEYNGTAEDNDINLTEDVEPDENGNNWTSSTGVALPAIIADLALPNTDVLMVKSADAIEALTACNNNLATNAEISLNLTGNCPGGGAVQVPDPDAVEALLPQDRIVLVTDCNSGGDMFQINNDPASSGTLSRACAGSSDPGNVCPNTWSASYGDTMQVFTVSSTALFVGVGASGEPALFRLDLGNGGSASVPVELAEGIENLQLRFGLMDAVGNINYTEADNVAQPLNIMAIAATMVIRSGDFADGTVDNQTFNVEGVNVTTPGDRRIRKVFSTTVAVRNRINVL